MEKIVGVGVGVIIYKGNKILLGKRKGSHGDGTRGFTGGHLDFGESWEECGIRETLEETGISIKNIQYYHTTNDIYNGENKHYVTIFLKAEYRDGIVENKEPEVCEKWEWFNIDEFPENIFLPIKNLLKDKTKLG